MHTVTVTFKASREDMFPTAASFSDVITWRTHGDLGLFEINQEDTTTLLALDRIERITVPTLRAPVEDES